MRSLLRLLFTGLSGCLVWTGSLAAQSSGESPEELDVAVFPAAVESPVLRHRLLPAEHELRDGNAATILLRLPWDQTAFMANVVPKFPELLQIPFKETDDIVAAGAGLPPRMYSEIRRAAYRRTADWEYPIDEEPDEEILLPDVQGSRQLVFQGLAIRIRFQVVQGQLDEAREGILVGLANARHYARTPFMICQLVAAAHSNLILDRLPELLQQPGCPNFFWSLTALPTPMVDFRRSFEFERRMLTKTIPGSNDLDKARSPDEWDALSEAIIGKLIEYSNETARQNIVADRQRMLELARQELPRLQPDLAKKVASLSEGELTVRWFLSRRNELYDRIAAASALPHPAALELLCGIESEMETFTKDTGLQPFFVMNHPSTAYLHLVRFDRRVAALRVVEALRHFAATHKGKFPDKLAEMTETPVPRDPLTGEPFGYKREPAGVVIAVPGVEDAGGKQHNEIELRISFGKI